MKYRFLILVVCLTIIPLHALADFSESSTVFDPGLAQYALQIAEMCYTPAMQESVLKIGGFSRIGTWNADRDEQDDRHVAAYSVYEREAERGQTEVIVVIRGTGAGEWKLNLDLMPSGNDDLPFAENFMLAAEDILTTHEAYLSSLKNPVFLITGHSRGAAVANLLGATLTDRFGEDRVFAYTFATPRTVRGERPEYPNIFNIVNPSDLITFLPFPAWGFERYGVDVVLPAGNSELTAAARQAYADRSDRAGIEEIPAGNIAAVQEIVSAMETLAPDIRGSYTVRHALSHPGEALPGEESLTAAEMMLTLFEGTMFSAKASDNSLADLSSAPNDFSPLLQAIQGTVDTEGSSWLLAMHMPAAYGAWISAITPYASQMAGFSSGIPE